MRGEGGTSAMRPSRMFGSRKLARTSAENHMTVKTPAEGHRDMSAPTEPVDPDFHLHTAWLAQVSEPAGAPVNQQAPRQGGSSTSASTISFELVDRVVEQDVALSLGSGLRRRSAVVGIS